MAFLHITLMRFKQETTEAQITEAQASILAARERVAKLTSSASDRAGEIIATAKQDGIAILSDAQNKAAAAGEPMPPFSAIPGQLAMNVLAGCWRFRNT